MSRLLRAIEVLAWVIFFAFAGLALALRFWLLPDIERYRGAIVAAISKSIGQPVKIGAIQAGWLGLRPHLSLTDVRIYDAQGREALVLPAVENVVGWRSLVYGELRLNSLVIDRPRLGIRRDANGALHVAGMKLSDRPGDRRFTDWILSQEEVVIRNAEIEWLDEKRAAPPLALSGLDLRLRNSGDSHAIGLTALPPAALGSTLDLRAELAGRSVTDFSAWQGRVYLEIGYTDLAGWRAWLDYPIDLRQGQGALRLWATLDKGEVKQATADLELAGVVAQLAKDAPALELASVRGRLQGLTREGSYDVSGRQLALALVRGPAMQPADFRITWRPTGAAGAEQGSIVANALELDAAAHVASSLPLPADLRGTLAELAPRGRLLDPKLEWSGPLNSPTQYSAKARFSDLALRPHGQVPGFAGLSGSFDATEAKGHVSLAAKKAELEVPRLFAQPRLPLESLSAQVDWERKGAQAYTLRIGSLSFTGEHVSGTAQASYSYSGRGPGSIDLTAQIPRADARYTARYLPLAPVLAGEVHDWLLAAIQGGQARDVKLRLKGDLGDFPFADPAKGQFQITAKVEKGTLDYVAGWPRISDIDGELLFERERMQVTGRSASILGARLSGVRVVIPKLGPGAQLLISGSAEGPTSEFLKYVESTPVRGMTGGFSELVSATGRGKLQLKLDLPLKDPKAVRLEGAYDLAANNITVHPSLPPIERATGRFVFTESSFTLNDLRGRIFGGQVALSGGSRQGLGVEVLAKGDAAVASLPPALDHPWRRFLSGAAAYTAIVSMRDGRTRIGVESSLRGVASALPPPLAKSAAEALPVRIDLIPSEGGTRDRISMTAGTLAAAEFLRRRQGEAMAVQRAAIWLSPGGDQPIRLPERPGTLVYGSLPALDLDRWMPLLDDGERGPDATGLDVKFGVLDVYGKRIHDLSIRAGADATGWSATVQAKELAGDVSYRLEKGGALVARLTHFAIPDDYPGAKPADPGRTRDLPAVDLVTERFAFRGKQFGRVEVLAQRAGKDWRIDRLAMVNTESSVTGRGLWRTGPPSQTSFNLELESSDTGKFLARMGYPDLVRGGKARMQASLAWSGDPLTIDYPSLSGDLQMQAEDGQFLEIEPGIGKLVSLMSLQALPRRLTLDFRDVFSKGFQFDRIASNAHVERGVMGLKEFKMRGSAAEVDMKGEVDLVKETQSLQVRVVPSLGDTASTVIALLNPLLVFPAAIAQRVLKDPLGHIFAFDYSVSGGWADPKVAKTRAIAEPVPDSPSSAGQ